MALTQPLATDPVPPPAPRAPGSEPSSIPLWVWALVAIGVLALLGGRS